MTTKRKIILSILGVIVVLYLLVYTVLTPFIRGVVVDGTTGQPVENAWVMATASIGTRTVAGDVGGTFLISRPHLRTGKDGVFYVFPKLFPSLPTPFSFGNMKKRLYITVRVMDGKRYEMNLSGDWWKRVLLITPAVKDVRRTGEERISELRSLYSYCMDGMYFPIYSSATWMCDAWELDYTISENKRYLTEMRQPSSVRDKIEYSGTLRVLSDLYRKKEEHEKALIYLQAAREFDLYHGFNIVNRNYDSRIKELEEKIVGK